MTSTTSHTTTLHDYRAQVATAGAAAGALAATLTTAFAHDWREVVVVVATIAVVTVLAFGLVVPRALRKQSAGGTALSLAIPAVLLTVPAFWSGMPLVLGVAGLLVGNAGRRGPGGAGKCIAAVVLSALAVLGYLAIYVSEGFAGEVGFLLD